jgi:hypothetical protein
MTPADLIAGADPVIQSKIVRSRVPRPAGRPAGGVEDGSVKVGRRPGTVCRGARAVVMAAAGPPVGGEPPLWLMVPAEQWRQELARLLGLRRSGRRWLWPRV